MTIVFFEGERARFFRPLANSRRELVAACLRALYERLHGPAADYAHNLNRESLKELLLPVVREYQDMQAEDEVLDEFNTEETGETAEPAQLTVVVIRGLVRDGWLEQYPDRQGLVTAFRLSRPGKLFAEAFWTLHRPSRSRQRNMRGCRNALEAALSERGDAHDLVDAYEYAEKVLEDLTEGIDYLQERVRYLMVQATVHDQWDEFMEFLERFQRDYSKQLTVDSSTLNRNAIRQKLEQLRIELSDAKFQRMEAQLHDIAAWALKEYSGDSVLTWLLDRIEEIVNAAHESKQPGFIRAMDNYVKRVTGLVQQSMMLRTGQTRHAYLSAVQRTAELEGASQDRFLARIGEHLASVEIRLLDPSSFKLRSAAQRRKAATSSVPPRATRAARLEAAMKRAQADAFAVANEELTKELRRNLRLFKHPVRLSTLPLANARDVLASMQTVEAVRNAKTRDLKATRLPRKVENEFYNGFDYEIDFKKQ
ncbi:MAG: Wadjet anti-phage system protein JetA family protein [Burkholderiaceae bacterium]